MPRTVCESGQWSDCAEERRACAKARRSRVGRAPEQLWPATACLSHEDPIACTLHPQSYPHPPTTIPPLPLVAHLPRAGACRSSACAARGAEQVRQLSAIGRGDNIGVKAVTASTTRLRAIGVVCYVGPDISERRSTIDGRTSTERRHCSGPCWSKSDIRLLRSGAVPTAGADFCNKKHNTSRVE